MKISKKITLLTILSSIVLTSLTACNEDDTLGESHFSLNVGESSVIGSEDVVNNNSTIDEVLANIDFQSYIYSIYNDDNYVNKMYNYYMGADSGNTSDLDGDGVSDEIEFQLGLDPKVPDSDGDGIDDLTELLLGLDPLKNDIKLDFDGDGLSNIEEIKYGTMLNNSDTDGDGLSDYDEIFIYKTNPLEVDTDGDGISDADELKIGLNPLIDTTDGTTKDNQRIFYQTINSDVISSVGGDDYTLSATVDAGGLADNCISINISSGFSSLKNSYTSIKGEVIDVDYNPDVAFADITLNFALNSSLFEDNPIENDIYTQGVNAYQEWVRQYKDVYIASTLDGIHRYVVFEYDETNSTLLPMNCSYNDETNTITIRSENPSGTYCLIDLYDWLHNYCNMF
ncbi:MAG: hypothetical protein ACI4WH_01055 [Oscillospiraceae bacterium]